MALTHILVAGDLAVSREWYTSVLGAELYREYEGSVVLNFNGNWILLVEGGGPTPDKPNVAMASPSDTSHVDHSFTIRVADCRAAYEALVARGATFLTPPYDWGAEIRCFFRDPDGHLFEISQAG
jgi:catechol 2,3-dioxygenase-like lactoylglutathione lyase family enzyme